MTYVPLYENHNWVLTCHVGIKNEIKITFKDPVINWFYETNIHDWTLREPEYESEVKWCQFEMSYNDKRKKYNSEIMNELREVITTGQVGIDFTNPKDAIRFKLRWL